MINNMKIIENANKYYGTYVYVCYPEHPKATKEGYVRMHILVAENKIGRRLKDDECVHHLDFDKYNNSPNNLIIFKTNADHGRFHKTGIKIEIEPNIFISPIQGRICPICEKEFYNTDSSIIYCSQECAHISQRKANRPSKDVLHGLILKFSFVKIGEMYGVSDNAVRKWCDKYNLPRKKTEINTYTDEDWSKI